MESALLLQSQAGATLCAPCSSEDKPYWYWRKVTQHADEPLKDSCSQEAVRSLLQKETEVAKNIPTSRTVPWKLTEINCMLISFMPEFLHLQIAP
ncbi:hypothetical protein Y1Q_0024695 [Alligator mississippiensis]|uniref:Uncharacterized protein n=1 Tax=Alligator mississippiensis TaxID=8496 RepID=A0A151PGU7_ALLMI|nr:hypothetical protein Y1Q_0024695 [Alligator mississippiensis]